MVSSPGLPVMVLLPSPAKMLLAPSPALIMSLPVSAKIVPLPSPVIRLSLFWKLIVWLAVLSALRLLGEPIDFESRVFNCDKSLDIPKSASAVWKIGEMLYSMMYSASYREPLRTPLIFTFE